MPRFAFYDAEGVPLTVAAAIADAAEWLDVIHARVVLSDKDKEALDNCQLALRQLCPPPRWFVFLQPGDKPWSNAVYAAAKTRRQAKGCRLSGNPNGAGKWTQSQLAVMA